jgi:hypothetical protein
MTGDLSIETARNFWSHLMVIMRGVMAAGHNARGDRSMAMTYREILQVISKMPEEHLDKEAVLDVGCAVRDIGHAIKQSMPDKDLWQLLEEKRNLK